MSLITFVKAGVQKLANACGYEILRLDAPAPSHWLEDHSDYAPTISKVKPFTMTTSERIGAFVDAVRHVSTAGIPGAIVECGVWRGGSMMAAALTLLQAGDIRDLYLFDTYAGMTAPTEHDVDFSGEAADERFAAAAADGHNEWCFASLEDVRANLLSTGYPESRCHFIRGDVLETIPCHGLDDIAVLRLDTDWYESTLHELRWLHPKLRQGGLLIVDDYGHWRGCRRAVDEYFEGRMPFLFTIDYTGRMAVRT